ncbi:MAG: pirin family protein [Candidatus Eisenbacteria bacterium]|nr:pirin family protein [Candidatus Eisenbacteria bacterium]
MIEIRRSQDRGHFDHGWLDTYHTFSFDQYYDPRFQGFRVLRVINEDRVAAATGFPMHAHRDMEILTWILEGALEHRDSMGNGSVIRPGEIQRMSAGTGVRHSEANPSKTEPVHLLQIWILPDRRGIEPGYEQTAFAPERRTGRLCLLASPDGAEGSVRIHQDARLYDALLDAGTDVAHAIPEGRHAWLQVARGSLTLGNGERLVAGDGAAVSGEHALALRADEPAEILVFDLP